MSELLLSNLAKNPYYLGTINWFGTSFQTGSTKVLRRKVGSQMWDNLVRRVTTDFEVHQVSDVEGDSETDPTPKTYQTEDELLKEMKQKIINDFFDNQLPNHRFRFQSQNYEYNKGQYFYEVTMLQRGSAFGELGLINPDNMHCATVVCETDCIFT